MMDDRYLEDLLKWREQKEQDLRQRDSWLALAGLHWLTEGLHSSGSAEGVDVRLPESAPPRLGTIEVRDGQVFFHSEIPSAIEGAPPEGDPLLPDTADNPTMLRIGNLTMVVIARGNRVGLRVWDNARTERTGFAGRTWYPPDITFRVEARFEPAGEEETIAVPSVTGDLSLEPLLGTARFTRDGRSALLRAVPTGEGRLWFLFSDSTNGRTTYPGGRFLVAEAPLHGVAILDFNRAYNPPCAFTPYATCPLPPEGNDLPISIAAGETYRPGHGAHDQETIDPEAPDEP